MNHTNPFLVFPLVAVTIWTPALAEDFSVPFPDALDAAAISVERLDSILDFGLLVGNGDVNALVYTEGGQLAMMLTKNDVWDARLDSALDPPLPTLDLIERLASQPAPHGGRSTLLPEGWGNHGADSYHAHPYPCPRACGKLILSNRQPKPVWRRIRAEGTHNAWEFRDDVAVMSIEGRAEASNGFSVEPLNLDTSRYNRLRFTVSGSENAQYYVDVMDADGGLIYKSGWTETPLEHQAILCELPPDRTVDKLILYTWTEDGERAENCFRQLAFEGPAGSTAIDLTDLESPTCAARLDIRRAVAEVAGLDDHIPKTEIRALADRNVFLIQSACQPSIAPLRSADIPTAETGETGGVEWLLQGIPGDLDWAGMKFAVAVASQERLAAVAIVTSREADAPLQAAVELASTTLGGALEKLKQSHEATWQRFWAASGVDLDDPELSDAWYQNLYFLRCVTKPGVIAPGLFASLVNDRPAWHGDYHTNYNIQQTFWSSYVTNHPELAEPYDRLIREHFPRARWLAAKVFSMGGAYYPHVLFAYEPPDPEKVKSPNGRQYLHHVWGFTLGVAGFTVQPLWWHYKYQPDRQFLEETAYPAVRDVAIFYADFIRRCGGEDKIVLAPSVSPEHWGWTKDFERNRNCTFDIAMVRYTLKAAIEGAETLQRDSELVKRWQHALDRLPDYPTTGNEQPIVVDVEDAPPITYNIAVPATPVFPGDVITAFSPEQEKSLFARTIEGLSWNGNNSAIMLSVARARLSMPGTADWVREELTARLRPNRTLTLNRRHPPRAFNNFGHYTEQFAASMAVSELLLQSVSDVVRVFPAWPSDRNARFHNLRAQGGFLVSAQQEEGRIGPVHVVSTAGGTLRLVSPWPEASVRLDDGSTQPVHADSRGIVSCETSPGEQVTLLPGL